MSADNDFVATEPLYLNKEGKVVKHNDPSKLEKLADVGHRIPYERAMELGLFGDAEESPAENEEEVEGEEGEAKTARKHVTHKAPARKK